MAQLYRPNGTIEDYPPPANGRDYKVEEMRAAIGGGWFEILVLLDGLIMVVDEEGNLKDLPPNTAATLLWRQTHSSLLDFIVGDALVCKKSEVR